MSYPIIYSLSTVGILKHYIHDYLFHPLRTDFIGSNGVGKSIIADLLQLLFIYDTDMIKFGTDGVKKEERSIYKLPYGVNIAYCFLNIEVSQDKYIIIGIAISAQVSTRIIPFVISKTPELNHCIDQLSLSKEEILTANDLLKTNSILDLKDLTSKLLQEKKIYLTHYRNKDDVKRYYQFLYDKEILSINLAIPGDLKAFAKVIQSFSKAKTLNLTPSSASKSLKEFLFEDSDIELQESYNTQQRVLEKLLKEFSSLDAYIKILRQKQQSLSTLKDMDTKRKNNFKIWKSGEVNIIHKELLQLEKKENYEKRNIEIKINEENTLKHKVSKLPRLNDLIIGAYDKAQANYSLHKEYTEVTEKLEIINEEITELSIINIVRSIHPEWKETVGKFDISTRNITTIKDLTSLASIYLRKYPAFQDVERKFTTQREDIIQLSQDLKEDRNHAEKFISILERSSGESVLHWILQRKINLDKEQRNLLLHYATTPTKKPIMSKKGTYYVDPEELFKELETEADDTNAGFWVKLGALREFVPFEDNADFFTNSLHIEESVSSLIANLKNNVELTDRKQRELDNISRGKPYDKTLIEKDFDLFLIDYSNVEKLKEAVGCVLYIDVKIQHLTQTKFQAEKRLRDIVQDLPVNIKYHEPEVVEKELKRILSTQIDRVKKYGKVSNQLDSDLKQTSDILKLSQQQIIEITKQVLEKQLELVRLQSEYYKLFSENVNIETLDSSISIEKLKVDAETSLRSYQVKYLEITNLFDETKGESNMAVELEKKDETYEFSILESTLLGYKIKHTDDITPALEDANRGRLNMADDIKNSMVKIFDYTLNKYRKYKDLVYSVNNFFIGRKISDRFFFSIDFKKNETIKIDFIEEIGANIRNAARQGELAFDRPVSDFIEEFVRKAAHMTERVSIEKLLNPRTYFDLSVSLTDENKVEMSGSTGETYSAIALLGVARLSIVQTEKRRGLRFIILEEIGSLDSSNFNTFPAIAKEFNYQIITMAPHPFRTSLADEWYAHHLIKGKGDKNINYHPSASYFKTNSHSEALSQHLKQRKYELDRVESTK